MVALALFLTVAVWGQYPALITDIRPPPPQKKKKKKHLEEVPVPSVEDVWGSLV